MKQVEVRAFGPPSMAAKLVDAPDVGEPAAWEVVVDVEAFPINVADLAMLSGKYGTLPKLPSAIGMEAVGTVTKVGQSVTDISAGDRVVLLGNNNWAERRKVPAATVHRIPRDIDPLQAAMFKVNPTTALLMLKHFVALHPNDYLLQTAPLGSVGTCVIQLARTLGLRTINVVRRPEAKGDVARLGGFAAVAQSATTHTEVAELIGTSPLSLALDAVAGPGADELARSLTEGGTIVSYGMLSGEDLCVSPEQTIFRNISLRGFWLSKVLNRLDRQSRTDLYNEITAYFQQGTLNIRIDKTFELAQLADALQYAEQGSRAGKVVVTTNAFRE